MPNPSEVIRVIIWDHSRLGGSMRTDTTRAIESRLFYTSARAYKWAESQRDKYNCDKTHRIRLNGLTDLGSIGIEFKKETIE